MPLLFSRICSVMWDIRVAATCVLPLDVHERFVIAGVMSVDVWIDEPCDGLEFSASAAAAAWLAAKLASSPGVCLSEICAICLLPMYNQTRLALVLLSILEPSDP